MKLSKILASELLGLLVLATSSLGIGIVVNQLREEPLPLTYRSKPERMMVAVEKVAASTVSDSIEAESARPPKSIGLEELREMMQKGEFITLDARPEIFHRFGHIPGALSLPREDFEKAYTRLQKILESERHRPIVVYCSGSSCEDSDMVRDAMEKLGYTHVTVFTGGWSAWTAGKLPEEKTE